MTRSVNDFSRYPLIPSELLANARVLQNRSAALQLWPKNAVIAEVGVGFGGFSGEIMRTCRPAKFIAIDIFTLHEIPELWGHKTAEVFGGRTHGDAYRHMFADKIAAGTVEVIEGPSAPSIAALPDDSVDLFYVDADHLYEGVRADLAALVPKVRTDGWIVMNDYIPADTFSNAPLGVIQATNEFMINHGWEMVYFAFAPVMYCDVGLRRVGYAGDIPPSPGQDHLAGKVKALEQALAETRASTSWRLTAPLRAVSSMFRRG